MKLLSLLKEMILVENTTAIYDKYYKEKMSPDIFQEIIEADPYTQGEKMGKYSKWLLNLYVHKKLKLEDLYKAHQYLSLFDRVKPILKRNGSEIDINKYTSLTDLYRVVEDYEDDTEDTLTDTQLIKRIKEKEAERFFEDKNWLVIIPKTERAACLYGRGTQWCTAATSSYNQFDGYNRRGHLYVFISKKDPSEKYQLHLQDAQFMDVHDDAACPKEVITDTLLLKIIENEQFSFRGTSVSMENGKMFLLVHDYVALADFFCEDDKENARTYLEYSGDWYSGYLPDADDFYDRVDETNLKKIKEKFIKHLRKEAGDEEDDEVEEVDDKLHEEEDEDDNYDEDDEDDEEDEDTVVSPESLEPLDINELMELMEEKGSDFKEEVDGAISRAASSAQESADESEAWNHTHKQVSNFLGLGDPAWVPIVDKKGEKESVLRYPCSNVTVLWSILGFDLYNCDEDEACCELDTPYYGFQGDMDDEYFNENLHNSLYDLDSL